MASIGVRSSGNLCEGEEYAYREGGAHSTTPTHSSADVAGRGMASIIVRSSGNLCEGEEYA